MEAAEEADRFLGALGESLETSEQFRDLLYDPAVPRNARVEMLSNLAARAGVAKQVAHFLATVVAHNRIVSLPSIARVFHEERETLAGIVPAEITTAQPLGPELEQRARGALERLTGRQVRLTAQVNPAILGGAVTRVGSTLYDGSLRTQLEALRRRMTQE
jgi:F-type H+-transporting ATPase subunit delta